MRHTHKANFGEISSGTLRDSDLIDAFAWELRRLRCSLPRDIAAGVRAFKRDPEGYEWTGDLICDLQDALDNYAPPYGYFGSLEGDGACFGFWLSREALDESDALRVSDTSKVPANYTGEVINVNDHGNVTLYAARKGKLREVWSLV